MCQWLSLSFHHNFIGRKESNISPKYQALIAANHFWYKNNSGMPNSKASLFKLNMFSLFQFNFPI
jgi:hypothetical protein